MIVAVKTVLAKIGDVEIRPAIVVEVAHSNTESPPLIRDASVASDVGERSIVIVVKQHGAWGRFFAFIGETLGL